MKVAGSRPVVIEYHQDTVKAESSSEDGIEGSSQAKKCLANRNEEQASVVARHQSPENYSAAAVPGPAVLLSAPLV